jgi:hypothetical protein
MNRLFLVVIGLQFLFFIGKSQDCTEFHQYQCTYADYTYFYSQQSKSILLMRGQSKELNIVAYAGEEYYVSVCAHEKFGNVNFRILEDNVSRTVIYDNAIDNNSTSVFFSNDRTRKLIVEISVPPGKSNDKEKRCIGVLIEFKRKDA